jgi:PAS domain S-box-containing protein
MTHQPLRVLVVDDDEDDFILIRDMLRDVSEGGYAFEWCATPEEGLSELRRGAHDVYLVDYLLGPASGLDLIEAVNREGLTRAFIVLTGRGNQSVDMAAMEAGASDYLVKGLIDAERLARSIRYAVDHTRFVEVLRESETCHRLLFDEGPVPLLLFDAHSREILTVNASAQDEYAALLPELVGQRFDELLAPHESERFLAQLASGQLTNGELSAWEYRRDGHALRHVEGIFHAMDYRGTRAVLAHVQDVSARVLADAQLHLLNRAIQCTGNGVVIAAARQPDQPIIFVNRAFERITGYSAAEVIGQLPLLQGGEDNQAERDDPAGACRPAGEQHLAAQRAQGRHAVLEPALYFAGERRARRGHALHRYPDGRHRAARYRGAARLCGHARRRDRAGALSGD